MFSDYLRKFFFLVSHFCPVQDLKRPLDNIQGIKLHKNLFYLHKYLFSTCDYDKKKKNLRYLFYDLMTVHSAYGIFGKMLMTMEEIDLKGLHDGNFYHVCTNGLEQITLLKDEEDYKAAWNYLALSAWKTEVQTVAFTIMSNHVHMIIACRDACQADKTIKMFKKTLSLYLKNKYGLTKPLHRTNDCISLIDTVRYLKNCIAYILRNAVCARISARPEDYRWSSYACYFSDNMHESSSPVPGLTFSQKRKMLKTGLDLQNCPLRIGPDGLITLDSFVRSDIAERAYRHSGKSFLYFLGCCNDARMEYELTCQPLQQVNDNDMYENVTKYVAHRFRGKSISDLTSAEKCSILKYMFFNSRTSIPQLSRILGMPRDLIRRILST